MLRQAFLIFVLLPSIFAACSLKSAKPLFKRALYEFSVDLVTRLAQDNERHFVTSPLSMWNLLSCTSLGATDKTLEEFKHVLQLQSQKCFNNFYLELSKRASSVNETDVFLERSSVIFADEKLPLNKIFENKITKTGISHIENIPFDSVESAAATINDFVSRATHDTINEIITPGDLEDISLIIIDALFFKGIWKMPFDINNTKLDSFYSDKGEKLGDVNFMSMTTSLNIATIPLIGAKVLELPYGENKRFSMLIFLPYKDNTLNMLIENLRVMNLETIKSYFKRFDPDRVYVQIPRFKITSDLNNLKELFVDMGLTTMFDSDARFPIISDYPLYVSNIIQKADIEVTEEGTTASAASADEFTWRLGPMEFVADKPFLFMIIDNETEIPIFAGAYAKPTIF